MREETKTAFCAYMLEELSGLTKNVIRKYAQNTEGRRKNPFLSFDNPSTEKFMGLGRSIDSQLGNRIQNIIFYLARIRYGDDAVPNIINISTDEANQQIHVVCYYISGIFSRSYYYSGTNPCQQRIYINGSIDHNEAKRLLSLKKAASNIMRSVCYSFPWENSFIDFLHSLSFKQCPVDLCIIETIENAQHIKTFEIKLSGNLDTKNAESNANEVERLKQLFSFSSNNQSYFASCYGECSSAVRTEILKKDILSAASILNGTDFWDLVLPNGEENLPYEEFIALYTEAFRQSGLERRITTL